MKDSNRVVHAQSEDGRVQVVRYDREGRWYVEGGANTRMRLSVHDAAVQAVALEKQGGEIFEGKPGGGQFDSKVSGCRRKTGSR